MFHDDVLQSPLGKVALENFFKEEPAIFYLGEKLEKKDLDELSKTAKEFFLNDIFPWPSENLMIMWPSIHGLIGICGNVQDDGISVTFFDSDKKLFPTPIFVKKNFKGFLLPPLYFENKKLLDWVWKMRDNGELEQYTRIAVSCLLVGSLLVSSKYMKKEKTVISEKLHKKRDRKQKPKLRDYITISLRKEYSHGKGGSGKPVACHWRRGHIRTLEDGRKIPVRECWVNLEWADGPLQKKTYVVKS